ncbi:hypothetical protein LCD36_27420 [Saccharopolyspora sp. 6T]|uniref:hypothetical protein n=1 Tax=Saccharopolyspora sp. 6T TaxID=2877238 RepID=UPI001CD57F9B|nr:hypothetical protein [Saccharopolyspora sp. 6T]MCA1190151.1 hypothetical protein [Saccharopolyspora sp. 6T]
MTTTWRLIGCASTAAALLLSGCGAPAPRPADRPAAENAAPVVIDAEVAGGQVRTGTARVPVPLGSQVRYQVRSDQPDEAHVHGFDEAVQLTPGRAGVIEFTADMPGVFEVELHHSGLSLPSLEVR